VFSQEGDAFVINAKEDVKALLLSGLPLNEPIVGQGPFVMNTPDEIKQAFVDFQSGGFGRMG
jgi:redox-sensitive bicupin YhaK (pirin superfamily)